MQTKSCTNPKCEQVNPQPVTEFYLNRGRGDGYNSHCKSCWRRYLEANREKRRLKQAEYSRTHKEHIQDYIKANRDKISKRIKEYHKANPDKRKEYYQANKQKLREQNLNSYRANLEQRKEDMRRWEKENREKRSARQRERRRDHPEMRLAQLHRRRARELGGGGSHTAEEWEALCAYYDYRCLCCKEQKPLTRDHVIPLSKGGSNDISNLQPLCKSCNSTKHDKIIDYRLDFIPN